MDYKKIYKKIEKRYIVVAIILILLFTSRQVAIQFLINNEKDISTVVNISGRQRMLSQKITKDVLIISEDERDQRLDYYIEDLESSLSLFEKSHYALIYGDEDQGLRDRNSKIVKKLFEEINPYFKSILASGNNILKIVEQENYSQNSIIEEVEKVKENETIFLEKMDKIVFQYDDEAGETILFIETIEIVLFSMMFISILILTMFVIKPATKTLRYAFIDINESNENIKKLFYSMGGLLFLVNKNGDIITMNLDAKNLADVDDYKSKSLNIKTAIGWKNFKILNAIDKASRGEELGSIEVQIEGPDSKELTMILSAASGKYNGEDAVLISANDITIQKEAEEIFKNMAIKDELTGLYNRHFLESIIEGEIDRAKRYEYPVSAAILDIDNFKKINDTWGHPVGDIILKEIADILMKNSRASDYVMRIGGEEFIVLMPHTNLQGAYNLAEKIRDLIENRVHPIVGKYTASFGVAEASPDEKYIELYKRIDMALYRAKESGRNRVVKSILDKSRSLKWKDSWNSGEKIIDSQHKELITILNDIINSSFKTEDKTSMINSFYHIIGKIEKHFAYEEKILEDVEYINQLEHKHIHKALLKKAYKLKEQAINEEIAYEDVLEFILHDLILGHLLKEDIKFFSVLSEAKKI